MMRTTTTTMTTGDPNGLENAALISPADATVVSALISPADDSQLWALHAQARAMLAWHAREVGPVSRLPRRGARAHTYLLACTRRGLSPSSSTYVL